MTDTSTVRGHDTETGTGGALARPSRWIYGLTAAAVFVWAVLWTDVWAWPAFAVLAWAWGAGTAQDLAQHRLWDRFTLLPFGVFVLLLVLPAAVHGDWGRWGMTIVAGLITATVLFVIAFINPAGFGLGDVKLGLTTGAALGWIGVGWPGVLLALLGTVAAFVLMAVVGVVLLATRAAKRDTDVAFGPFMVLGVLVAPWLAGLLAG
ncbi:hypothetical protein ACQB6R_11080 [Propionibacteriaceae bacterium G1746]